MQSQHEIVQLTSGICHTHLNTKLNWVSFLLPCGYNCGSTSHTSENWSFAFAIAYEVILLLLLDNSWTQFLILYEWSCVILYLMRLHPRSPVISNPLIRFMMILARDGAGTNRCLRFDLLWVNFTVSVCSGELWVIFEKKLSLNL